MKRDRGRVEGKYSRYFLITIMTLFLAAAARVAAVFTIHDVAFAAEHLVLDVDLEKSI